MYERKKERENDDDERKKERERERVTMLREKRNTFREHKIKIIQEKFRNA